MSASNRWNGVGSGFADGAGSLMAGNVAAGCATHKPFCLRPRLCLRRSRKSVVFASEFLPSQALADESSNGFQKPAFVVVLALVEPECLLVEVSEKVEGFNGNVSALDRPLEQAPEVFQPVCVDVTFRVALGMINDFVRVIVRKAIIGLESVRVDLRSLQDILAHVALQLRLLRGIHDLQDDTGGAVFRAALQQTLHRSLASAAGAFDVFAPFMGVHVPRFATDVSFVHFRRAADLHDGAVLHRFANPLEHEPSRFLADAQGAGYLVTANTVFRIGDQPSSANPLIELDGAILENSSKANRELPFAVLAFPNLPSGNEAVPGRVTMRASNDTIGPAHALHIFKRPLVISEVFDYLLKRFREFNFTLVFSRGFRLHAATLARQSGASSHLLPL